MPHVSPLSTLSSSSSTKTGTAVTLASSSHLPIVGSKATSTNTNINTSTPTLHLQSIDTAFGSTADLYTDVLKVKPSATSEQIQRAYFDRRNDLFRLLAGGHPVEPHMDAVVMTGRILGDVHLRRAYDAVRPRRLQRTNSPSRAVHTYAHVPTTNTTSMKRQPPVLTTGALERMPSDEMIMRPSSPMAVSRMRVSSPTTTPSASRVVTPEPKSPRLAGLLHRSRILTRKPKETPQVEIEQVSERSHRKKDTSSSSSSGDAESRSEHNRRESRRDGIRSPEETLSLQQQQFILLQQKARAPKSRYHLDREPVKSSKSTVPPPVTTTSSLRQAPVLVMDDDDHTAHDNDTIASFQTFETETCTVLSVPAPADEGILNTVRNEILGVIDDASRSMEQVMHVFTLDDNDIRAVCNRIDKAKRQMGLA
jgi:hypothetical protein